MTEATKVQDLSQRVIEAAAAVHKNLSIPVLYEHAVRAHEGKLLQGGSFAVRTGSRTGRSPKDKFVVRTPETAEHVWWGAHNQPIDAGTFDSLRGKVLDYL